MSCGPGFGHYAPMVALARALQQAGHGVMFATGEPLDQSIRSHGFKVKAIGLSFNERREARARDPEIAARLQEGAGRSSDPTQDPAPEPGAMRSVYFPRSFAGLEVPPKVDGLRQLVRGWQADLLIHEAAEFAGPLVGALEGVPTVNHSYGPLIEAEVMAAAGAAAAQHWLAHGLPAPDRGGMYGRLYLDIAPPSMQFPHIATIPAVQPLRPVALQASGAQAPWLAELGRRPVVTVTFGTVFNNRADLYQMVLDGLGSADLDVIVATGHSEVAPQLTAVPANVQVHEWVPWSELLARSSVVVTHGGASSTLGPLALGVPLVMIPLGADHFTNAELAAATGAATVLDLRTVGPDDLRDAVATALAEPARSAAGRIAAEIAEMPSPEAVVPVLEGVARS
jgi:UDP:flavonoid glycosyltransferase YjiC (YdhE family)